MARTTADERSIWTSDEARARVLAAYAERLDALGPAFESRMISTSVAQTHVLLAGPEGAPRVVVVHGANGDATQMAAAYADWTQSLRCVFVDVPGEPNRSEGVALDKRDDTLARWLGEVLDGLDAPEHVALLGMSGGAYVALRAALGLGARVRAVAALVPEGFVEIEPSPEPTPENAAAFVEAVTAPDSGFPLIVLQRMAQLMALTLAAVREPMRLGPLFSAEEFRGFETPVMIVAGGADALFPGAAVLERARAIVPSLRAAELIPRANHIHLELFRGPTIDRVFAFLAEAS